MHPLDASILAGFVVYALVSGLAARRQASLNLDEYFLAGRRLKGWQAGLSMAATQFSADTPLLVTGLIATAGVFSLWRIWIYALAFLLLGFVLAPAWRRAHVLTDAELSELRYGSGSAAPLRLLKALYFGVVFNGTVLAMVLVAATRIAEPFLHWHLWLPPNVFDGVEQFAQWLNVPLTAQRDDAVWTRTANNMLSLAVVLVITAFYSTTGGLRAVVRTDLGQLALAMLGTIFYAGYAIHAAGGWSTLPEQLSRVLALRPELPNRDALLAFEPTQALDASGAVLAVIGLQWLLQMNADGTGYLAQRCMACRTDHDARRATVVFSITQVLVRSLVWLAIGVALLVVLPPDPLLTGEWLRADREASFVAGIQRLLPPGIRGLLLTALLAALASTLDSHLNWGASYFTNDIYRRFICPKWLKRQPRDRELVVVARLSNLLIIALALAIMAQLDSIQSAWHISLLLGSGMGVILVLRWLWWRITAHGELACIAASLVLAPTLLATMPAPDQEALRLLLMALGASGAGVLLSWLGPAEPADRLQLFYERVRPPGFWAPQTRASGGSPRAVSRQLGRRLLATFLAALSLFCALSGLGTWLIHGTPPTFLPWRLPWILSLLVVSVVLIAACVKLLRDDGHDARAQG